MLKKIKILHLVLALCSIIILLRFNLILKSYLLIFYYFKIIFSDTTIAYHQLSLPYIDIIVSALLIIFIPVWLLFKGKSFKIFQTKVNFSSLILVLLSFIFIFAPLISNFNPDFQKNIGVTKLLPPFSSVMEIHLKNSNFQPENSLDAFLELKSEVVKNTFDEKIIFADSVKFSNPLIVYQKNYAVKIEESKLQMRNGKPLITTAYFLLGTDELGRDVFSRLIYGARISLFVGFGAVFVSLIVGLLFGFLAGYPGGFIDTVFSRVTDMFLAFPVIFLIILILALFGNSLFTVIIVLGFSGWMSLFKIVRGEVISIKGKDYFITAKQLGLSKKNLLIREILPVILAPVIVNLVFQYGNVILAEAALSFLGLGTGNSYPSWGAMIEAGQNYLSSAWWMILFPGIALFVTLFTANNFGKELQVKYNPRLNK